MPGHVRTILRSFVSGQVLLLSRVCFCIAGSIIGGYGYLGVIYSCPEVEVNQGHAMECFRGSFRPLLFQLYNYREPRGHLEQNECQIWNRAYELTIRDQPCVNYHPRSPEVI